MSALPLQEDIESTRLDAHATTSHRRLGMILYTFNPPSSTTRKVAFCVNFGDGGWGKVVQQIGEKYGRHRSTTVDEGHGPRRARLLDPRYSERADCALFACTRGVSWTGLAQSRSAWPPETRAPTHSS